MPRTVTEVGFAAWIQNTFHLTVIASDPQKLLKWNVKEPLKGNAEDVVTVEH